MGTQAKFAHRPAALPPEGVATQGRTLSPPTFSLAAAPPQVQTPSVQGPSQGGKSGTAGQTAQRGAQTIPPSVVSTNPSAPLVEINSTSPDPSAPVPVRAGEAVDFRMGTSAVPGGVTDRLETHYQIIGPAEFGSMGSGNRHQSFSGVYNGEVPLIVSGNFQTGNIEVMVEVRNVTQGRIEAAMVWQLVPQVPPAPMNIAKAGGPAATAWADPSESYKYRLGPDLNGPVADANYEGQTFSERFGNVCALGFDMGDLNPNWKLAHPGLNTPDLVARHLFSPRKPQTFTVGAQDIVADQHPEFGPTDAFRPSVLASGQGVGYRLEQSYGLPGSVYGRYNIDHRIQFGKHQVRKSDPLP
jgi:hypothetical protein